MHNALADAKHQVKYVSAIWKRLIITPITARNKMIEQPDDLLTPDEVCQKLGITQKHYVNGIQNTGTALHWPL